MSEKPFKIKKLLVSFSVRSMAFHLRDERHGIYGLQLYTHYTHFPLFSMSFGSASRPPFESWTQFLISRGESEAENVKPGPMGQVLHFQFET